MSTGFGPPGDSPFMTTTHPWVWVLIPVGIVVAVGALAVCLHSRRRRQSSSLLPRHSSNNMDDTPSTPPAPGDGGGGRRNTRSHAFNARELEEAWVRGAPQQPRSSSGASVVLVPVPGGRLHRPPTNGAAASRWYWASGMVRPEEGLNEFGEAPPPYEKQVSPPPPAGLDPNPSAGVPTDESRQGGGESTPKSASTSSNLDRHHGGGGREGEVELNNLAPTTATTVASDEDTRQTTLASTAPSSSPSPLPPAYVGSPPPAVARDPDHDDNAPTAADCSTHSAVAPPRPAALPDERQRNPLAAIEQRFRHAG